MVDVVLAQNAALGVEHVAAVGADGEAPGGDVRSHRHFNDKIASGDVPHSQQCLGPSCEKTVVGKYWLLNRTVVRRHLENGGLVSCCPVHYPADVYHPGQAGPGPPGQEAALGIERRCQRVGITGGEELSCGDVVEPEPVQGAHRQVAASAEEPARVEYGDEDRRLAEVEDDLAGCQVYDTTAEIGPGWCVERRVARSGEDGAWGSRVEYEQRAVGAEGLRAGTGRKLGHGRERGHVPHRRGTVGGDRGHQAPVGTGDDFEEPVLDDLAGE